MRKDIVTVTLNPAIDRTYDVNGFSEGKLHRALGSRVDAGGKGINVVRALKKFGIYATATGFNGGAQGKLLISLIEKENLQHDFFEVSGETRLNIKIADRLSGLTTEVNEPGFCLTEADGLGFIQKLDKLCENAEFLVLSGSLPRGLQDDFYAQLIEYHQNQGVKVILDADNESLKQGMKAKPFAIKPNLDELSRLVGKQLSTDEEVISESRKLIADGVSYVAVTLGERGIFLTNKQTTIKATPFAINPVCTTGSGDSALAAFIYCMMHHLTLRECASYMVCTGTLSALKEGTVSCTLNEVQLNLPRIKLDEVL